MSPQATNYLLSQVDTLGYVSRRPLKGSSRRLVYLTARGRKVGEVIFSCLRALQDEWANEIRPARFRDFMSVLREIANAKDA